MQIPDGHQLSPQTLSFNPRQHEPVFGHGHTFPGLTTKFIPQHPAFSGPTRLPFEGQNQILSLGPRRPYKASCSLLGISPAAAGQQDCIHIPPGTKPIDR